MQINELAIWNECVVSQAYSRAARLIHLTDRHAIPVEGHHSQSSLHDQQLAARLQPDHRNQRTVLTPTRREHLYGQLGADAPKKPHSSLIGGDSENHKVLILMVSAEGIEPSTSRTGIQIP